MLNKNLTANALTKLQKDLYNIASNHDGILDMIVFGFTQDMSPSQVKHYQDMLNVNFPDQTNPVDNNPVRGLNF